MLVRGPTTSWYQTRTRAAVHDRQLLSLAANADADADGLSIPLRVRATHVGPRPPTSDPFWGFPHEHLLRSGERSGVVPRPQTALVRRSARQATFDYLSRIGDNRA